MTPRISNSLADRSGQIDRVQSSIGKASSRSLARERVWDVISQRKTPLRCNAIKTTIHEPTNQPAIGVDFLWLSMYAAHRGQSTLFVVCYSSSFLSTANAAPLLKAPSFSNGGLGDYSTPHSMHPWQVNSALHLKRIAGLFSTQPCLRTDHRTIAACVGLHSILGSGQVPRSINTLIIITIAAYFHRTIHADYHYHNHDPGSV